MARINVPKRTAMAALTVLAGCAGASVIIPTYRGNYTAGETGGQDIPVAVRGNPFGIAQQDFDREVRDAMQGSTFGQPTRFVAEDAVPNAAYRMIMDFGGGNSSASMVCARRGPTSAAAAAAAAPAAAAPSSSRVALTATLCRGDEVLVDASGSIGAEGGPQGEQFRRGVSDFTLAEFPAETRPSNGAKSRGNSR